MMSRQMLQPAKPEGCPAARLPWCFLDSTQGIVIGLHAGELRIGTWQQEGLLTLRGAFIAELMEDLQQGAFARVNRARLQSLAEALEPRQRDFAQQAAGGHFRPATPLDFLRRNGFEQIWIELTAQCQQQCVHCYANSHFDRREALARDVVLTILDDAVELGFRRVQYTGGDPLLCPFLVEAVAAARQRGLGVELFTNGLALTPSLLQSLAGLGVSFAFSLYADRSAEHDEITGVDGSWRQTVAAIGRARSAGCSTRVSVIVMPQNAARAQAALAFARTLVAQPQWAHADVRREVGRGRFDPAVALPADDEGAMGEHRLGGNRRLGKVCVAPDGSVFPCIYSRWLSMGRIGQDGGLRAILERPRPLPEWRIPSPSDPEAFFAERLTCHDCRTTAAYLSDFAHAAQTT